ncbi:MAG: EVE domain-containing protein [Candidatus Kapaibacteriota bacterium]
MQYFLVKSEPFKYSWDQFQKEGSTFWDGVRNYQARNTLMSMKKGDMVLFYHSNEGLEIVGIAKVAKEYYPDPTINDDRWCVVDLKVHKKLKVPISLSEIKKDSLLKEMALVKQSRLSVMHVTEDQFHRIISLSGTKI